MVILGLSKEERAVGHVSLVGGVPLGEMRNVHLKIGGQVELSTSVKETSF